MDRSVNRRATILKSTRNLKQNNRTFCNMTWLVLVLFTLRLAECQELDIVSVTPLDTSATVKLSCPTVIDSSSKIEVTYVESDGVAVVKTISPQQASDVQIKDSDSECALEFVLRGLSPIKLYNACFSVTSGDSEKFGPRCTDIGTTPPIEDKVTTVSINLEGVALVVMTALGLLFSLMVCVFYDKVIEEWIAKFRKRNKKKPQHKKQGHAAPAPRVSVTVNSDENKGDREAPPNRESLDEKGSEKDPRDSRDLSDEAIKQALEQRPYLMKAMAMRRTDIEPHESANRRHGADNLGYMHDEGPPHHYGQQQQRFEPPQPHAYASSDYRQATADETHYFFREREAMNQARSARY